MKRFSNITSVETKSGFREKMVEKYVQQNMPPKSAKAKLAKENREAALGDLAVRFNEIECCAAELPVHGTVEILFASKNPVVIKRITYPSTSRFIVFCCREDNADYKVAWSCSLS